jgi:predicted MPP superfamily phosphohydrolase
MAGERMTHSTLRRAFFSRVFLCLALLLGGFQVLVWHWWTSVALDGPAPGLLASAGLAVLLAAANGFVFPLLRRHRRSPGWRGVLARVYQDVGVSTLVVGLALAALWLAFLVPSGLLGMLGASPEAAFGAFRLASVGLVAVVVALLVWGFTGGQAGIERTRHRAVLPGLAPELAGLRVAQISDLHIGNHLDGERLSRLVERVNAEGADAIVMTGDLFDFDPAFVEDGVRRLAALRAPLGVYAVLGNHDIYTGADAIAEAMARLAPGIRLLRDEIERLPTPAPLYIAGVEDSGRGWADRRVRQASLDRLASLRPSDGPTLILVHRPELFGQAAELGFPLMLAGHTHGGQLALPVAGGHWNVARFMTPLTRGFFRERDSVMYVNRGLGVGGPALRVACPREISLFELQAA